MILAIDFGTTTGWATDQPEASGTLSLRGGRFEGGGMRFLRFRRWLDEMHALHPVSAVYFEEVRRHLSTDAAHLYGGFLATMAAWAEQNGIAYQGVPVGTIKKHATGKGNAGKAEMLAAYFMKWDQEPQDDNEADARWLLDLAVNGVL